MGDVGPEEFNRQLDAVAGLVQKATGLPMDEAQTVAVSAIRCCIELDEKDRVILRDASGKEVTRIPSSVIDEIKAGPPTL